MMITGDTNMSKKERAKLIEQGLRLTWDSLQSHLPYTHSPSKDGELFHKKCVKEYSELISILSKLF